MYARDLGTESMKMNRYAFLLLLPLWSLGCDGLTSSSRDDDEDEDEDDDEEEEAIAAGGSVETNISRLESFYEGCVEDYDDWVGDIEDAEEEDDVVSILNAIAAFNVDAETITSQARLGFAVALEGLDDNDREDAFEDYIDTLEDEYGDCLEARDSFSVALSENQMACEHYFEWREEQEESWEDWDDAREDYGDDCYADPERLCLSRPLEIRSYEGVPEPQGISTADYCSAGSTAEQFTPPPPPPQGTPYAPPDSAVRNLGTQIGNSVAMGMNAGESDNFSGTCGSSGGRDVVLQWTAPYGGYWIFDTSDTNYDTVLRRMQNSNPLSGELTCDDDGGSGMTSLISAYLSAGETVYIVVDAYTEYHTGRWVLDINPGG